MNAYPLATLIAVARTLSPFYRQLYEGVGDAPALTDLPLTDQKAYWAANTIRNNKLLTGPLENGMVFKSGGTTGAPKFSVFSQSEWRMFTQVFGEGLDAGGLRNGERIANMFYAGELYASFIFIMNSLTDARAPVLQFPLSGKADIPTTIQTMIDFDIDVIAGTSTTLIGLADHLLQTNVTLPGIRRLLFGGESLYPDQREMLARAFPNAHAASIGYASVDAGLLGYADTACAPDEHRVFDHYTILEILDEETNEPIRETGRLGRIVVTNLTRLLMPIIRYPVGDRGMWLEEEGAPNRKFKIAGRSEEGARIGPVTLYVEDVALVLKPFNEALQITGFQMIITHHDQKDRLTLKLASHSAPKLHDTASTEILSMLFTARPLLLEFVERDLIHPPQVEWVHTADLAINPRTGKLKRVLDLRWTDATQSPTKPS